MKIGTKSLLFGVHQFVLHPLFVAAAWWRLFGFPWDPRLWFAFALHDVGYWGLPNMDGPEGERHIYRGAEWMSWLFDRPRWIRWRYAEVVDPSGVCCRTAEYMRCNSVWYDFCLFHSRHYARKCCHRVSRLCLADKLAICLMPAWLYLPLAKLSAELPEYMANGKRARGKVSDDAARLLESDDPREWLAGLKMHMRAWVDDQMQHDTFALYGE